MDKIILYSIFAILVIGNIKSSIHYSLIDRDYKYSLKKTAYYLSILTAFLIIRFNLDYIVEFTTKITAKYLNSSYFVKEIGRVLVLVIVYFIIQIIINSIYKLVFNTVTGGGELFGRRKWSLVIVSTFLGSIRGVILSAFILIGIVTYNNVFQRVMPSELLNNFNLVNVINKFVTNSDNSNLISKVNEFIPASNVIIYYNGVTLEEGVKSKSEIDDKARALVLDTDTDIEKAKKLYVWVGSNIDYDYTKARKALSNGDVGNSGAIEAWQTRTGICFDYACLYVAMARAVDLKVRLVTGNAYDGSEFGPHAWNQIYSDEEGRWVNVDPTFYQGGNYFDSKNFDTEHITENIAGEW